MSDADRRTARTVPQTALALAVLLPALVDASGAPATLPRAAGALAVAGAVTRVMALPGVQALPPPWLRAEPQEGRPRPIPTRTTRWPSPWSWSGCAAAWRPATPVPTASRPRWCSPATGPTSSSPTEARLDLPERSRWPLASIAALTATAGVAIAVRETIR